MLSVCQDNSVGRLVKWYNFGLHPVARERRGPKPIYMYYVYILKNLKTKNLYIGYTRNLQRRINEHRNGKVYTTKRLGNDVDLVYYEAYKNENDARDREKSFKSSGSVYNGLVKRIKRSRGDQLSGITSVSKTDVGGPIPSSPANSLIF